MVMARPIPQDELMAVLHRPETEVVGAKEERELLRALSDCRQTLAHFRGVGSGDRSEDGREIPQSSHAAGSEAQNETVWRRYQELRSRLAMANLRLVAHVANRYRDRGVAYSDLLQEGFCGLLEAIDRFDLSYNTRLATYAMAWIRQALQRAIAASAYPVRLNPKHLRQLALYRSELSPTVPKPASRGITSSSETMQRILNATRPTVPLDSRDGRHGVTELAQPERVFISASDADERLEGALGKLGPREQEILRLRFGLNGRAAHSLSQIGKSFGISRERVRQIEAGALRKLRTMTLR